MRFGVRNILHRVIIIAFFFPNDMVWNLIHSFGEKLYCIIEIRQRVYIAEQTILTTKVTQHQGKFLFSVLNPLIRSNIIDLTSVYQSYMFFCD